MNYLPIPPNRPLVLFTDLDGTLIDHHSYSAGTAVEALARLARHAVPVIFCSSKTFAEQQYLQQQLGVHHPFILENGSAVAVPKGYFSTLPTSPLPATIVDPYNDLYVFAHAGANAIRAELPHYQGLNGFYTASDAALSDATGLHGEALARARDRWYTETIIPPLQAQSLEVFNKAMTRQGWTLSKGGRFYTVQSAQVDKGKAVRWLQDVFRQNLSEAPFYAAIGDSPNDVPMLAVVDFPFLVQQHNGMWADVNVPGALKIEGIGPAGFSAAVKMLLGE